MPFSLKNKKAVLTGAGSGIGKAIAILFAQQEAEVYIIDLTGESAQSTVKEINSSDGNFFFHICDVSDQNQVVRTFNEIGTHDILINNAGIAHIGKAGSTSEEDFDRVMKVNVKGVYNCFFASLPFMEKNGGGVIINMASVAAWCGLDDRFVYSTAKGAVAAMTLSVAKDYIYNNIRCNSISPGHVHTPFVDGFLKKITREKKKKCLINYRKHNRSAGWQSRKRWLHWLYIYAVMKLLLLQEPITLLTVDF